MGLYEVTLQQRFAGQRTINRWNYLSTGIPAAVSGSFALVSALGAIPSAGVYPATGLMRRIADVQHVTVDFELITVANVYDPTDFYTAPLLLTLNGTRPGESMAPFVAIGFRSSQARRDIRRGAKRFVGVSETDVVNEGRLAPPIITGAGRDLAVTMSANLTYNDEGNVLSFAPTIVSKERYTPDPNRPQSVAYRYYATEALQLEHVATGINWQLVEFVRSQTSRQVGRGR